MTALYQLLYLSDIDRPFDLCHDVVEPARVRNETDGITGMLMFDGFQVCQYVEGPQSAVQALKLRLLRDRRHSRMRVLHEGTVADGRRFENWLMGWAETEGTDSLGRFSTIHGESAVRLFVALALVAA